MKYTSVKRILIVGAIVAVVVGSVIAIDSTVQASSSGWYAFAPLSGEVFTPSGSQFVSTPTIIGAAIVVLGLMAGSFWAGLAVAQRRLAK